MQSDVDSSAFEVVSTADWLQLLTRHAPGQEDQLRCVWISHHLTVMCRLHSTCKHASMPDSIHFSHCPKLRHIVRILKGKVCSLRL